MSNREFDPEDIKFTPLTEGLGFHPFSDGLPYAPVTKAPQPARRFAPNGAGAVSAGPARLARVVPRISVPVAEPTIQKTVASEPVLPEIEPTPGFTYLFKRIVAYGLDFTIHSVLGLGGFAVLLAREEFNTKVLTSPPAIVMGVSFVLVFHWAMTTAQEVAFGTSVGKRICGLVLRGGPLAIFSRALLFTVSIAFCGIGLIWAVFNRDRRCWHDAATNLQPSEAARL